MFNIRSLLATLAVGTAPSRPIILHNCLLQTLLYSGCLLDPCTDGFYEVTCLRHKEKFTIEVYGALLVQKSAPQQCAREVKESQKKDLISKKATRKASKSSPD